jgi:hypothetical protein
MVRPAGSEAGRERAASLALDGEESVDAADRLDRDRRLVDPSQIALAVPRQMQAHEWNHKRRLPTGWGAAAATLMPLNDVIRTHVFAAECIHADNTTVPALAKN